MTNHICDKALLIEQHGRDLSELFDKGNGMDRRLTEIETELHGHTRNGGGFITDTKETLEVVRMGVNTLSEQLKVIGDKRASFRSILVAAIPSLIVGGVTIATVLLTRK